VKTVILCGGKGTRAFPHTVEVPKPLLEIGDRAMLHHVMEIYASQGFCEFVLAAGYKAELIDAFAETVPSAWSVTVLDTGEDTNTGERVRRCGDVAGDPFFATYADGLGNVDLAALLAFHTGHAGAATLTTVPLPSQYGTIDIDGLGRATNFKEKPQLHDHRINAGFFVFDQRAFESWEGHDLEREVLPHLAGQAELYCYPHEGFWKSADTYKDTQDLSSLCDQAPWLAEIGDPADRATSPGR
jgi:glucose-1-phosphate cytidylyltransferase